MCLTLSAPHFHKWGQTTQNIGSLPPKRQCGPKRVKVDNTGYTALLRQHERDSTEQCVSTPEGLDREVEIDHVSDSCTYCISPVREQSPPTPVTSSSPPGPGTELRTTRYSCRMSQQRRPENYFQPVLLSAERTEPPDACCPITRHMARHTYITVC